MTDAIAVMANLYFPLSSSFEGVALGAINKAEALSANQTTMVFFKLSVTAK